MNLRLSAACLLTVLLAAPLAAQVPEGDSAWREGRFHEARIAYEHALKADSLSVRANYRLAVLASWDSKLDSALVLLGRARRVAPEDPDLRLTEATILSWQGRFKPALIKYDSLLAQYPDRHDIQLGHAQTLAWASRFTEADAAYARMIAADSTDEQAAAGRAQVAAWRGDLPRAIAQYRTVLERDPQNPDALAGLAQIYHWQGRERLAREQVDHALAADSNHRPAREVRAQVRAALRPELDITLGWSHDSDQNTIWWQTLGTSMSLAEGLRGFASAGVLEARDPSRTGTRISGEVGASYAHGNAGLTAALGLRRLSPQDSAQRTAASYRVEASYRIVRSTGVGVGYAHYAFDETALLISRRLNVDGVDLGIESTPREGLGLSLSVGAAWLSDNNSRRYAVASIGQTFRNRLTIGVLGRTLAYDFKGSGYFSPDRFRIFEGRAGYVYGVRRWESRLSGGLGIQQVGTGAAIQSEWHLEARIARRWAAINEVALSAGVTNSAVSSTTGAFRYETAALTVKLGL